MQVKWAGQGFQEDSLGELYEDVSSTVLVWVGHETGGDQLVERLKNALLFSAEQA